MRCFSFAVIVFFILALGGLGSDFGFGISRILGGIFLPYQLEEAVELFLDDLAGHFGAEYLGHALVGLVVQISGAAGDQAGELVVAEVYVLIENAAVGIHAVAGGIVAVDDRRVNVAQVLIGHGGVYRVQLNLGGGDVFLKRSAIILAQLQQPRVAQYQQRAAIVGGDR